MTAAPRRRAGTLVEEVPGTGECVLFEPVSGQVLALNPTGAAVWDLLDGERTPADLAAILHEATGVEVEVAARDVEALLRDLEQAGFLEGSW